MFALHISYKLTQIYHAARVSFTVFMNFKPAVVNTMTKGEICCQARVYCEMGTKMEDFFSETVLTVEIMYTAAALK